MQKLPIWYLSYSCLAKCFSWLADHDKDTSTIGLGSH